MGQGLTGAVTEGVVRERHNCLRGRDLRLSLDWQRQSSDHSWNNFDRWTVGHLLQMYSCTQTHTYINKHKCSCKHTHKKNTRWRETLSFLKDGVVRDDTPAGQTHISLLNLQHILLHNGELWKSDGPTRKKKKLIFYMKAVIICENYQNITCTQNDKSEYELLKMSQMLKRGHEYQSEAWLLEIPERPSFSTTPNKNPLYNS